MKLMLAILLISACSKHDAPLVTIEGCEKLCGDKGVMSLSTSECACRQEPRPVYGRVIPEFGRPPEPEVRKK